MKHLLCLMVVCAAVFSPAGSRAEDLTCMPAFLCIDDDCEAGHDMRLAIVLTGWNASHPKLISDFGSVAMRPVKRDHPKKWTGTNAEGQTETLTLQADMSYVHLVKMEPTSAFRTLKDKGHCEVTK